MPEEGAPCRDFERGVCTRGDDCKYFHPEKSTEPAAAGTEVAKLPICKDFQNKGCDRRKCKFLHITHEEEAIYNSTGNLPEHGGRPELISRPPPAYMGNDVCKDFLNGKCDRGPRCKFVHIPEGDLHGGDMGGMYGKRSRMDGFGGGFGGGGGIGGGGIGGGGINDGAIMEENELLRRKITELQREILSLREMNDTLYDQNTRYCSQLQKAGAPTAPTPQVNVPHANPVVYPQFSQAAYPAKAGVLPTGSTPAAGAYSYMHY